ncbi:MAG: hypothetical protein ACK4TA_17675 [Saprospiraceae bacterium]
MKNILFLLLFSCVCSCDPAPSSITQPQQQFRTTPPARLYFKNMRSYYYQQSTEAETKIDFYTLKKFQDPEERPLLMPVIADNWLEDEAYIFFKNDQTDLFTDTLHLQLEDNNNMDTLVWTKFDYEGQYLMIQQLFEALQKGHKINVYSQRKTWIPLFDNQSEYANFLRVVNDYYNLTEKSSK